VGDCAPFESELDELFETGTAETWLVVEAVLLLGVTLNVLALAGLVVGFVAGLVVGPAAGFTADVVPSVLSVGRYSWLESFAGSAGVKV
jgi:hypothetical protein